MEINVKNISVNIGKKQILKNINISVKNKEFVGIIGPNGSGKSTLLKTIYRVIKPQKGDIFFDGKNIKEMPLKESAKKLAVVSQINDCSFDFKVCEIVLMGREPHKNFIQGNNKYDYEIMRDALDKVEMIEYENESFFNLSGGQKQRVILARALAQQGNAMVLDEPTNHLDMNYQLKFMQIIKKLNLTTIAAIHDMNLAAAYCDKLCAIKNGEIIFYGNVKEILTKENIKEIFDMDVEVEKNKFGYYNILYKPY